MTACEYERSFNVFMYIFERWHCSVVECWFCICKVLARMQLGPLCLSAVSTGIMLESESRQR